MAQIYEKKDYHMKANKKIPKRGTEIVDEDGESALSLYRGINEAVAVNFDTQNFVSSGDGKFTAMTIEENV